LQQVTTQIAIPNEFIADYDNRYANANQSVDIPPTMASYNIENCFQAVNAFRYTIFFFVYEAKSDSFVVIHNIKGCNFGCNRIHRVASVISQALRINMSERFQGQESDDLVLMISTGDNPRVKSYCIGVGKRSSPDYCGSFNFAPILQSGSVFVGSKYLPSMIAFPMPVRPHLPCFDTWQLEGTVCQDLQPKLDFTDNSIKTGLVYGKELGIITEQNEDSYWDDLISTIIWRGTDFVFLHTINQEMRRPTYALDIEPKAQAIGGLEQFDNEYDKKQWVIQTLWDMGEKLLPRWRGVLLTSEAEIEAEHSSNLENKVNNVPWVNIKFANINDGGEKVPASEHEEYKLLSERGISVIGDYVTMTEQAKYKYHIDLGGGGGTTWTVSISLNHCSIVFIQAFNSHTHDYLLPPYLLQGTIEKLALPGLLFHHVTPTKDWFHDLLVPWEHYVPVNEDLSDLKAKYDWAQKHPREAKNIAENGTRFARWMGTMEGFSQLYEQHFLNPLKNVVNAYQPTLPEGYKDKSVIEIIESKGEGKYDIVSRCTGLVSLSCDGKDWHGG